MPFAAYAKENIFKLFSFDVGILAAMSNLRPKTILDYDYGTYKGYFAENFIMQEFLVAGENNLYSYHEKNTELEFLLDVQGEVIPVEVKSGFVTRAKSLRKFVEKYKSSYSIIFSANNLYIDSKNNLHFYPLYLANKFIKLNF